MSRICLHLKGGRLKPWYFLFMKQRPPDDYFSIVRSSVNWYLKYCNSKLPSSGFYWSEIILKFFMRQTWVSVRKCTSVKVNSLRFVAFSNCNKTTHKERAGKNCSAFYGSYCQCLWWESFKMKNKYNL